MCAQNKKLRGNFLSQFRHDQPGSVFILVIWMTVLLSFFVVVLGSKVMFALSLIDRHQTNAEAYGLMRGGAAFAGMVLENDLVPEYDATTAECVDLESIFKDNRIGAGSCNI